ncbi:hypothetical protein AU468_09355 [Alkalispirochaeta sphaeroplastigenens]|uniref:DUF1566 domain-containing protein n=1 Tax=Alkalispirochaeta sphaeroplastigenens TaxID=1187066 RepID=A0A2S4JMU8_9SPIO|nr:hypothetical protein [Alkalispirochaeta sphaeroplastigenens]POR00845.1 hypothetical protein AU468_09355 [Alkalispirochaeta sphaeroplastigenens]
MKKGMALLAAVVAVWTLTGCSNVLSSDSSGGESRGALRIVLGEEGVSQQTTLEPELSMDISSWVVSGTGPGDAGFDHAVEGENPGQIVREGLRGGDWTITVEAKNAEGDVIGRGRSVATVRGGSETTTNIRVSPLEGKGTLKLEVRWRSGGVSHPQVVARLERIESPGDDQEDPHPVPEIEFAIDDGGLVTPSKALAAVDLHAGYYRLFLSLNDGESTVACGGVRVVRIVKGGVTRGVYDYTQETSEGRLRVTVTQDMASPLEVSIEGHRPRMMESEMISLRGVVSSQPSHQNISYQWFVNGELRSDTASLKIGDDTTLWPRGFYQISLIATTSEGNRAGSAAANLEIGDYIVGERGPAGGWIFYENSRWMEDGWRYLEAAPQDAPDRLPWGDRRTVGEDARHREIGFGLENTEAIIAFHDGELPDEDDLDNGDYGDDYKAGDDYAALYCYRLVTEHQGETFADWFLPSWDEALEMMSALEKDGGFASQAYYWTSTEHSRAYARVVMDGVGVDENRWGKGYTRHVRPVRRF